MTEQSIEVFRKNVRLLVDSVNNDGVPEAAIPIVFEKGLAWLLDGAAPAPQVASPSVVTAPLSASTGASGPPLEKLAQRLRVDVETVEAVYFMDGDSIELVVPAARFDTAKSRATEQIALLVAAGRQATGIDDDWTSVDPIRQQCEHFKKFDSSNFAGTIKSMDNLFTVRGNGRDRKVRMTSPAWTRASELVQSLVAGPAVRP